MSVGDAMMVLGRSQCGEGSADQRQQSAEEKYSRDRHVALLSKDDPLTTSMFAAE
jgi:hypothetical protein